ncbi:hypothetical protein Hdeb2414_s0021g00570021 [Helianthus debilis subsp. tardiflorus]
MMLLGSFFFTVFLTIHVVLVGYYLFKSICRLMDYISIGLFCGSLCCSRYGSEPSFVDVF